MVEQAAVERLGGDREPSGSAKIRAARARIAARVVVREEDGGAPVLRRVDDDLAKWKSDPARIAQVVREVQAPRFVVEVGDPEALLLRPLFGKAIGEEAARRGDAGELERDFGTLMTHAGLLLEGGGANDRKRIAFGLKSLRFDTYRGRENAPKAPSQGRK